MRRRDRPGAFRGRTAIVTGGAPGIGRAVGHALAGRGALDVMVDNAGISIGGEVPRPSRSTTGAACST